MIAIYYIIVILIALFLIRVLSKFILKFFFKNKDEKFSKKINMNILRMIIFLVACEQIFINFYLHKNITKKENEFSKFIDSFKTEAGFIDENKSMRCRKMTTWAIYSYSICLKSGFKDINSNKDIFIIRIANPGGWLSLVPEALSPERILYDGQDIYAVDERGNIVKDYRRKL